LSRAPQGALLSGQFPLKAKTRSIRIAKQPGDKDTLSQQGPIAGTNTFSSTGQPHAALETPDGKNNGAGPAAFKNREKSPT